MIAREIRIDAQAVRITGGVRVLHATEATCRRIRKPVLQRQDPLRTDREDPSGETLPHPPESLREEALPLREQLAAAGFATPALDGLIDDPESLRFHSINEIVDELDVIAG